MKIAIDCRMIGTGGIGTYISELIPRFLANHKCTLIGDEKNLAAFENAKNTEICPCDARPFSLKEMFFFPREILEKINSCDAYYTPYCNIPNGITVPIFSTIHDIVFLDIKGLASPVGTFARKMFYQRAINKSTAVFTVSKFSENRIKEKLQCKRNIIVTYNACPSWLSDGAAADSGNDSAGGRVSVSESTSAGGNASAGDAATARAKNSTANSSDTANGGYILFVGNIKKHKGLHTLLSAFSKAREKGIQAKLVIVGNAENFRTDDSTIKSKIDDMPEGSVRFTGKISDDELRGIYQNARLLVQPSLYEGFGLPPLEALTLGTNALISDIEVFKEIYAGFPVHFFKSGSSDDLAEKIVECANLPPPENVPDIYSFDRTYGIISAGIAFYK